MARKILVETILDSKYESIDGEGLKIAREYGKTPNGNDLNGQWVLRDVQGNMVDFDGFRNDLAERHNLDLRAI